MAETAVVARLKAVLTGDSAGLRRDLDQSEKRLKKFGDNATRLGRSMTTRLTLPIVGVGAAAVKTAADFERSMTSITALVGVARDEVKRMEGDVRSMAVQFGKSGTEAANALFFITSAGLRGSVATDTLAASLKASAIGLGDTATIADLATSALNAYGADTLSASQATDVLTAAVREGKLEAGELAGSMGRVLPLASAMNVSFNEVGAAFAALSRTGTNAAEAATQIRGILSSLLRPTKQAEEALEGMGLSSEGLRRQIREEGLLATLQTLSDEFAGNEAAAAAVFGNIRALSGVLDLMGANVATTEAIFASMADTTGAVDSAFEEVSQTASFQFAQAMAEVKDGLLTLGQELMPLVTDAAGMLSDAVRGVTDFFDGMSDGTKQLLITLTGVAAIAGPVALGIGGISKALVALKATNPWVIGMTIAFTGLLGVMGTFNGVSRETEERAQALREEFRAAGEPLDDLVPRLQALSDEIRDLLPEDAAEQFAQQMEQIAGSATLLGALEEAEIDTSLIDEMGLSIDDLVIAARDGTDATADFTGALEDFIRNTEAGIEDTLENAVGRLGRELTATEQAFVDFIATQDNEIDVANRLITVLGDVNAAFRKVIDDGEDAAESYINSGDVFRDLSGVISEDYIRSLLAAGEAEAEATGRVDVHAAALENVERAVLLEAAALRELESITYAAADAHDALADATVVSGTNFDAFIMALAEADAFIGNDIEKVQRLVHELGILDGLTTETKIAIGLEIDGLDEVKSQLRAVIDTMLAIDRIPLSVAEKSPMFRQAMEALQALEKIGSGSKLPGFAAGGGGGGGLAEPIDEAADAAERAQQELDRLSVQVERLGSSMMGRDFAMDMFGASPDEIADMFENLVGELDALGLVTEDNFEIIGRLGRQFQAAAAAAQELADATQALADGQAELARRQQVLDDIEKRYANFRDEFMGGDDFTIMGGKDALTIALDAVDKAMPRLRDAQAEVERLTAARDQYRTSIQDMFSPGLAADSNVMAQTQRLLGQARQFRDNLIALQKRGFPPDVIAEVVNAGLRGGAKIGSQLLRMGSGEMADFLKMREEIARLGASTSKVAADVMFGADITNAEGELDKQRTLVDNLFKNAVAEARKQAEEQEKVVDGLKEALEAATAQMEQLVNNIQINLFNAFNNFLSKIGGEVTTLTATPYTLDVDLSAIDRLADLINTVGGGKTPLVPPRKPPGPGDGGGVTIPTPAPAPAPAEQMYTVKAGDGPYRIIKALTGSASGWASKGRKLWQHNGLFWNSSSDWQTIHPGQMLRVPALAAGGYAKGGMPHLVGEMGPELFVPDSSGYVVPNHMLGGGSQTVNVTINTHAGMRAEDIVREIERYTRRRGQLSVPTTGTRRY